MGMIAPAPYQSTAANHVLVVDDEPQLVRGLTILLRGRGYVVSSARTASEGLAVVAEHPPAALLLNLALPDGEAIEVCSRFRRFSKAPILLISAIGTGRENARALDAGADDYMPKPFRAEELLRRLNRLLSASAAITAGSKLEIGEVVIDVVRRRVTRAGAVLLLEPREFELVRILAQRGGRIVTDQELLRAVWGDKHAWDTHRLRIAVARLRAKLERDPSRAKYVVAEPGIGYRLCIPGEVLR
ncbi:MAG TPA: response regulator transcription factor [Solirubrobacteraceae bacterium]|nr:response regulator transcription factor [Solirubrobacteraceae bacterium]